MRCHTHSFPYLVFTITYVVKSILHLRKTEAYTGSKQQRII